MIQFRAFQGKVTQIDDMKSNKYGEGCVKMISLQNQQDVQVNFILSPNTYVLNQDMINVGDMVSGYYDGDAPAIMIYPPQYPALVMVKDQPEQMVKVSYFNHELLSQDHELKLNITANTPLFTGNGQAFTGNPGNRNLIVIYGPTTKSIPAQTSPYYVVVLC